MRQIPHPLREFESLQHRPRRWIQTVAAYFLAWKLSTACLPGRDSTVSCPPEPGLNNLQAKIAERRDRQNLAGAARVLATLRVRAQGAATDCTNAPP